ncbi:UNVERIFIED_CONTAM: hypothetical protein NCL1_00587 [Trichonephila clavipes]
MAVAGAVLQIAPACLFRDCRRASAAERQPLSQAGAAGGRGRYAHLPAGPPHPPDPGACGRRKARPGDRGAGALSRP